MEKKLGMPVSFNCDRETVTLAQSQLGFIDAIVFPLFSVLIEFFEDLNFTVENLKKNREYFKGVKENKENKEKGEKEKEEKEEKEENKTIIKEENEEKSED